MTIIYRETDPVSGRWTGNSSGIDLSAFQIDQNFYEAISRIVTLENNAHATVSISYITQTADTFTFHMTDHTLQGPFTIPQSTFHSPYDGTWQPVSAYSVNDTFTVNGALYLVIWPHTSAATFSAGASDGLGHNYYSPMLTVPGSSLPTGGAAGMMLAKVDGHDFHVQWKYPVPVGGNTGQYLVKVNATDFNMQWKTLPTASVETLSDVISVSPLLSGQVLEWNGTKWQNATLTVTFSEISDMVITSATFHDLLRFDGTHWVNVPQSALALSFTQMTDNPSVSQLRDPTITALGTSGSVSLNPALGNVFTITPSGAASILAASTPLSAEITLIITAPGTTSHVITFDSSNFKSTGTLAVGTVAGKSFVMKFISDGIFFYEVSRTVAM